jgi:type IV secretory pathway TraG/TraD family ATPase VirD4
MVSDLLYFFEKTVEVARYWVATTLFWIGRFFFVTGALMLVGGALMAFADKNAGVGFIVLGTIFLLVWYFIFRNRAASFGRGGSMSHARDVNKRLAKGQKVKSRFNIGGVIIPRDCENRHFLFSGTTGSGKSTMLKNTLAMLEDSFFSGDKGRVVTVDSGGELVKKFYNEERGDIIFNLFDSRSVKWCPLAEIKKPWDVKKVAKSMIPDSASAEESEWRAYGRTLLENVLLLLNENVKNGKRVTNADIYKLLFSSREKLKEIFPNYEGAKDGNERMFGSIRAVMEKALGYMEFLDSDASNEDFSFSEHAKKLDDKAWLFVSFKADQKEALSPLIGTAIDLIVSSRLSVNVSEFEGDTLFVIMDEFGGLGKVSSVDSALSEGRKYGLSMWIGIQSISQVYGKYGEHDTKTILGNLNTWIILRTYEKDTAEALSKSIGDREEVLILNSNSKKTSAFTEADTQVTSSEQLRTRRVVMAEEVMALPDLSGYIKVMNEDVTVIEIPYVEFDDEAESFIEAKDRTYILDIKIGLVVDGQEKKSETEII